MSETPQPWCRGSSSQKLIGFSILKAQENLLESKIGGKIHM